MGKTMDNFMDGDVRIHTSSNRGRLLTRTETELYMRTDVSFTAKGLYYYLTNVDWEDLEFNPVETAKKFPMHTPEELNEALHELVKCGIFE